MFLHTASNQKLDGWKAWERGYDLATTELRCNYSKTFEQEHMGDGTFVPCREVVLFSEVFFQTYWKVTKYNTSSLSNVLSIVRWEEQHSLHKNYSDCTYDIYDYKT